jgi:hypothetical protein
MLRTEEHHVLVLWEVWENDDVWQHWANEVHIFVQKEDFVTSRSSTRDNKIANCPQRKSLTRDILWTILVARKHRCKLQIFHHKIKCTLGLRENHWLT